MSFAHFLLYQTKISFVSIYRIMKKKRILERKWMSNMMRYVLVDLLGCELSINILLIYPILRSDDC